MNNAIRKAALCLALTGAFLVRGATAEAGSLLPDGTVASAKVSLPDPYYVRLTGTIGGKAAVTMNLTRHGESVGGYYQYDRVGQPIEISGTLEGAALELTEYGGPGGESSGAFEATLSFSGSSLALSGSWETPDGAKSLPVALKEDWANAIRFDAFAYFESRLLDEKNEEGPFAEYSNATVCPPEDSPHRFAFMQRYFGSATPEEHFGYDSEAYFAEYSEGNLELYEESSEDMAPVFSWSRYSTVTPMLNGQRYVVLRNDGYEFTGGAHGMPYGGFDIYDVKAKRFLSYKDFWKPGSEDKIAKLLTAAFRVQRGIKPGASLEDEGCFVSELPFGEDTQFYVCKAGLVALYQAYEVLPYAEGLPTVFVPFKDIEPYLLADRKAYD